MSLGMQELQFERFDTFASSFKMGLYYLVSQTKLINQRLID